jgi:hypothetical protein
VPAGLRAAVSYVMGQYSMSERHAGRLVGWRDRRSAIDPAQRRRARHCASG